MAKQLDIFKCELCGLSLIHLSEPTRLLSISYAVFCLKKQHTHDLHPEIPITTCTLRITSAAGT